MRKIDNNVDGRTNVLLPRLQNRARSQQAAVVMGHQFEPAIRNSLLVKQRRRALKPQRSDLTDTGVTIRLSCLGCYAERDPNDPSLLRTTEWNQYFRVYYPLLLTDDGFI